MIGLLIIVDAYDEHVQLDLSGVNFMIIWWMMTQHVQLDLSGVSSTR